MKNTDEILNQIAILYNNGNKEEADRLYKEEYLPLVKKEISKMKKELKEVF